jgi:hypothetical protein
LADPRAPRALHLDIGETSLAELVGNHVVAGDALQQAERDGCSIAPALAD